MTTKVELIENKEFAKGTLDTKHEAFVIYIAALNICFNIDNKINLLKIA